jgi:hypothetical protein
MADASPTLAGPLREFRIPQWYWRILQDEAPPVLWLTALAGALLTILGIPYEYLQLTGAAQMNVLGVRLVMAAFFILIASVCYVSPARAARLYEVIVTGLLLVPTIAIALLAVWVPGGVMKNYYIVVVFATQLGVFTFCPLRPSVLIPAVAAADLSFAWISAHVGEHSGGNVAGMLMSMVVFGAVGLVGQFSILRMRVAAYLAQRDLAELNEDLAERKSVLEQLVHERTKRLEESYQALLQAAEKQAGVERDLRRSESRFRALVENFADIIVELGETPGDFRIIGPPNGTYLGRKAALMSKEDLWKLAAAADDEMKATFDMVAASRADRQPRAIIVHPKVDGRTYEVQLAVQFYHAPGETPAGLFLVRQLGRREAL